MLETTNKDGGVKMFKPGTVCIPLPENTFQFGKLPLLPLSFAGLPCSQFFALRPLSSISSLLFPVSNFYGKIQSSYSS